MRKILLFTSAFTIVTFSIYAQATVTTTIIEKENRNAVMIQIDQPVDITAGALEQRMNHAGLSGKTHRHVTGFKGVTLSEITSEKVDIYTKVEKGESKNSSMVYMAVSMGYNNFTSAESDSVITENIKTFLNSFVKDASAFSLDLLITGQMDDLNSEQKAYDRLLNDQKDMEKSKADIESSLIGKEKEIKDKKQDLDRMKRVLDQLKGKRIGLN